MPCARQGAETSGAESTFQVLQRSPGILGHGMAAAGTTSLGRHLGVGGTKTVPLNPTCCQEGGCLPLPNPAVSPGPRVKWLSKATAFRGFWEELHKHHHRKSVPTWSNIDLQMRKLEPSSSWLLGILGKDSSSDAAFCCVTRQSTMAAFPSLEPF